MTVRKFYKKFKNFENMVKFGGTNARCYLVTEIERRWSAPRFHASKGRGVKIPILFRWKCENSHLAIQ